MSEVERGRGDNPNSSESSFWTWRKKLIAAGVVVASGFFAVPKGIEVYKGLQEERYTQKLIVDGKLQELGIYTPGDLEIMESREQSAIELDKLQRYCNRFVRPTISEEVCRPKKGTPAHALHEAAKKVLYQRRLRMAVKDYYRDPKKNAYLKRVYPGLPVK